MAGHRIDLRLPDDWHVHLRDGAMLEAVLPATAAHFGRAMVMPNLTPPVRTAAEALAYRARIKRLLPADSRFEPLMAVYLTDATRPHDLRAGFRDGVFHAAKLYPAGATTNAEAGVTSIARLGPVLETLQAIGMPLLVHGEVVDPAVDVFDREAVFIARHLVPLRRDFPALKLVLEHVTTREGVAFVESAEGPTAATITPHHLLVNRNAMFERGLRPHMYCLPVAKRESHRLALRAAATGGNPRFFFGSDSAPHARSRKEHDCGCAGIFNAPVALACCARVFAEEGRLDRLEDFVSVHGARFYGLAPSDTRIALEEVAAAPAGEPLEIATAEGAVRVFAPPGDLAWRIVPAAT